MPINYNLYLYIPPQRVSPLREEYRDYTIILPYCWGFDTRRVITPEFYVSRTKHTFEVTILLDNEEKRARILRAPRIVLTDTIYKINKSYKYFYYDEFFNQEGQLRSYDWILKQVAKEFNMNIQPTTKYSIVIIDSYTLQYIPSFRFAPKKTIRPIASQGNLFVFQIDNIEWQWSIDEKNISQFTATNRVQLGNHQLWGSFITSRSNGIDIVEIPPTFIPYHIPLPYKIFIATHEKITIVHPEHEYTEFSIQPDSRLLAIHFRVSDIE